MNLRDWWAATARSWLLVLAAGAVGAASGVGLASTSGAQYTAVARVAVVVAPESMAGAESAYHITQMIRSELSLYQALARSVPVAERAAARVPGVSAVEISGATAASGTDQVVVVAVTLEDAGQSIAVAKVVADELAQEIEAMHPGAPSLVRAEAIEAPVGAASSGLSLTLMGAAGGVLGLMAGLTLAWWLSALRPVVGSGRQLARGGQLVLQAQADEASFRQLGAVVARALKAGHSDSLVLVGSGQRVNVGPWRSGVMEHIGARAASVAAVVRGADSAALDAVSDGAVTVLLVDRRDSLTEVEQAVVLLQAAGADLAVILVVSEPQG